MTIPPTVDLGFFPTPLHHLDRFAAEIGSGPRLWIKRDDQSGLATGGNKARKLEFLMRAALDQGASTVVTGGATQSNHARQTAAAAARLGLRCTVVLVPGAMTDPVYTSVGNILLDRLLGADIVRRTAVDTDWPTTLAAVAADLEARGETPFVIPLGGSDGLGSLGYARCAQEIVDIRQDFDAVVLASGTGGTQAGLIAGFHTASSDIQVHGMCIANDADVQFRKVNGLISAMNELTGAEDYDTDELIHVDDRHLGAGYGVPTFEMRSAVETLARSEGILLDPVYTGKAMAGLIEAVGAGGGLADARNVIFLHTGGQAALNAYPGAFS